ncbi:hypothetical protein [Streptomyces mirabilis]
MVNPKSGSLGTHGRRADRTLTGKAHKAHKAREVEVKVIKSAAGETIVAVGLNGVPAAQAVDSAPADGRNDRAPRTGRTEPTASPDAQHGANLAVFLPKSRRRRVMPARRRLRR